MSTSNPCSAAWRRRVAAYHDGGIVGTERNAVEMHIRDCATCQELLHGYDQVYRALRTMPGFEGVLTITRPGTRRGIGSAQRPSFTYPGRSYAGPDGMRPLRAAGGGSIVISLLLIMGVIFLVGRNNGFFGPSALPAASATPIFTVEPTYAAALPGGAACANQRGTALQPYVYTDASLALWEVVGCGVPLKVATLPANVDLGAWSPDDSAVLAFAPPLPERTATTITRLYMAGYNHALQPLDLRLSATGPLLTADDAVWMNTTTLIVRSHMKVLQVDLTKQTVTLLPFTATQIEWRNNALIYSTVANGQATLRRFDPAAGTNTRLLSLGVGQDGCQTWQCWSNAPWDVSADGNWVALLTPLPQKVPTNHSTVMSLVLQSLTTKAQNIAGTLSVSNAPMALHISPDDHYIAASGLEASQTGTPTTIASLVGSPTITVSQSGRLVWRLDCDAVVISPFGTSATMHPIEVFMGSGNTAILQSGTGNYDWQG